MSWYKPSSNLKKKYTSSDKIEEQICAQRPSYDKTGLGFLLGQSAKKSLERKELDSLEVKKDLNSDDTSTDKENIIHSRKDKQFDQYMHKKRKESFAWCDEPKDIEDDCKVKSFKPISKFYCHNCHGYGHYAVDCKKPKFDSDNANSRMHRNTNHIGNRRRSHSNESRERR